MRGDIGRKAFGMAAIIFGIAALTSRDFRSWQQVQVIGDTVTARTIWYAAGAAQLAGGIALQWRRSVRFGAELIGAAFVVFALLAIPAPIHAPRVYNNWNSVFEQLSMAAGGLVIYASTLADTPEQEHVSRIGGAVFGVCIASFAVEQFVYLHATAGLVPAWIPLGKTFWAIATTVALALAAIALLSGLVMPFAARLLAAMLVMFDLLIWVPSIVAHASDRVGWSEGAETLAIAATAWVLSETWEKRRT